MTQAHEESRSPAPPAASMLDLMAAFQDDALADLHRLHLMFLLDTDYRCRFSYLRDTVNLTGDRLRRHVRVLRSRGYVATSRDTTGALSPVRQHTVGAMLIELGENLHQHANTYTPPKPRALLELPDTHDSEPS